MWGGGLVTSRCQRCGGPVAAEYDLDRRRRVGVRLWCGHEASSAPAPLPLTREPTGRERAKIGTVYQGAGSGGVPVLTDRECQVLRLIAEGGQDAEIAERIGYKEWIVSYDVRRILDKLGARNRAHAVRRGWEEGYLGREAGR